MTKKEGFVQVFDHVGSFGAFQVLLLLCITLQALVSWHHLSYVFLGAVPPHWCHVPGLKHSGWTPEQIRNISIPNASAGGQYSWETCEYYDYNYTNLLATSNNSFEATLGQISQLNSPELTKCSKWDWDLSVYQSTVVTEFDLVCDRRILVGTIQGSYMLGVLLGSLVLGSLSDQLLGRRRSVLISTVLSILGGFASAFSTSYQAFVFFRFIVAAGVAGSYQNCYVLMLEYTSPSSRALFGLMGQISFAFGYMLIALLGHFFRNWADLQLACSVINLILLSYYWILPESARWLAHKGQDERAYKLLKLVARLNRKPVPDQDVIFQIFRNCRNSPETLDENQSGGVKKAEIETESLARRCFHVLKITGTNYWKLLQTPELRKRTLLIWALFIIVDLVYYGVVFDSATLTDDPYMLVFIAGLMEVPAYTLVVPCLTTLGRRPTVVGTFFLTAICSFAVAYAPIEYKAFRVVVSMSGKLFITTCFAVLYLLGAELFPTATRTTGLASAVIMGRIGSILAPYIVDMMKTVYLDLPNIIFGIVSLAAGVIAISLPETRDSEMPDDIKVMEKAAFQKRKESIALSILRRDSKNSAQINGVTVSTELIGNGHCDPS